MNLIDHIERLGHASSERGMDRNAAIQELRDLFEIHPSGRDIDHWSAGDLLDDWRDVRRRYEAIRTISHGEVKQLRAIAAIEAETDPASAEQTEIERNGS